jgi:hypothetical protein
VGGVPADAVDVELVQVVGVDPPLEQPGLRVPGVWQADDVVPVVHAAVDLNPGGAGDVLRERPGHGGERHGRRRVVGEFDQNVKPLAPGEINRHVIRFRVSVA